MKVAQLLRDARASSAAQANYRRRAAWLHEHARAQAANNQPLSARKTMYYAKLVAHAAQAEFMNP